MVPPITAIIHAQFLATRHDNLKSLNEGFTSCGTEVVIVTGPEPPMDNPQMLKSLCLVDTNNLGPPNIASVFSTLSKNISVQELSCALKHATALQFIAGKEDQVESSWHFVVEDDVIIRDIKVLMHICENAPRDADILMFGIPTNQPPPEIGQVRFDLLMKPFVLPVCDCYAVRMRSASILSKSIIPIRFCMNTHLSWIMSNSSMNVYVTSPTFSMDGTKYGTFVGSINSNNPLILNKHYMQLAGDATLGMDAFYDIHAKMEFNEHPEVRLLLAKKLDQNGRHTDAIREYAATMDLIEAHNGVLGQNSDFMRSYLDSHKYHQLETSSDSS